MVAIVSARPSAAYLAYAIAAALVLLGNRTALAAAIHDHWKILVSYAAILQLLLPFSLTRNSFAILHFGIAILSAFLGLALTTDLSRYRNVSGAALLVVQCVLLFLVCDHWTKFSPLDELLSTASSNNLTATVIVLQLNFMAAQFALTGRTTLFTAILTLIICLIGYGRASMVVALAIMAAQLFFPLPFTKKSIAQRLVALTAFCWGLLIALGQAKAFLASFGLFSWVPASISEGPGTKLALGLRDQARTQILTEYVRGLDIIDWILGGKYTGTIIETAFNGNPHIAYVRSHHLFGLPYLLILAAFGCVLLWKVNNLVARLFLGFVAALYYLRATTEPIMFPTVYDAFFFALCLGLTTRQNLPFLDRHLVSPSERAKSGHPS